METVRFWMYDIMLQIICYSDSVTAIIVAIKEPFNITKKP